MKPLRLNKVIGLSVGERSLLAAEVVAGDRPEVKRLAEFVYPDGISPLQPAELGAALGAFLRDNNFSAKSAVVGLPARWLVVKAKEVPPADTATLTNLLRLQAEGEFSTELKDLVYDYAADVSSGNPRSVLLIATSRRYVDGASAICEAAKLNAVVVTASAVALGTITSRSVQSKNPLVLLVSPAGAELTAQSGSATNAIRHLRGPGPDRPFVGELRRAISAMPPGGSMNGSPRELVLWDAAGGSSFDSGTLGETLGLTVRTGDLPIFGVDATVAASNGEGRKFAAAVALALLGVAEETRPVDFLHSRLAPVAAPKIPRWVVLTSLATILVLALVVWAYSDMQDREARLTSINADIKSKDPDVKVANAFVDKVSFAQAWHMGDDPRYLACLTDLTAALPRDGQTYAISLSLKGDVPPPSSGTGPKVLSVRTLSGRLEGKTTDQKRPQQVVEQLKVPPVPILGSFLYVKSAGSNNQNREVTFTITFTYVPPKPAS